MSGGDAVAAGLIATGHAASRSGQKAPPAARHIRAGQQLTGCQFLIRCSASPDTRTTSRFPRVTSQIPELLHHHPFRSRGFQRLNEAARHHQEDWVSQEHIMCLTRANAAALLDHFDNAPPSRGYTCTQHHAGYLSPGDLWRPHSDSRPRVVTAVSRHQGRIVLTDQYGMNYAYPADGLIPTALPDPLAVSHRPLPQAELAGPRPTAQLLRGKAPPQPLNGRTSFTLPEALLTSPKEWERQ